MSKRKSCFVPGCTNSYFNTPDKVFVSMPRNEERRRRWFSAVRKPFKRSKCIYACEDHFDLPVDAENWMFYRNFGGKLYLKPNVIPHRLIGTGVDPLAITQSDRSEYMEQEDGNSETMATEKQSELAEGCSSSFNIPKRKKEVKEESVQTDSCVFIVVPAGSYHFIDIGGKQDETIQVVVKEEMEEAKDDTK